MEGGGTGCTTPLASYGSNLSIDNTAKTIKAVTNVANGYNVLLTARFCISCTSPWQFADPTTPVTNDGISNAGIAVRQYVDCSSGDLTLYSSIASAAPSISYWVPNPIAYNAGVTETVFGTT